MNRENNFETISLKAEKLQSAALTLKVKLPPDILLPCMMHKKMKCWEVFH